MNIRTKKIARGSWGQNFTTGRSGRVQFIVVHNTGTNASAENNLTYFASRKLGASAHIFINKDGTIHQSVEFKDTAWHCGTSGAYRHATARNSNSVGIEVVNNGSEAFTAAQIAALKSAVAWLKSTYGITNANVIRHWDVTSKACPNFYRGGVAASNDRWKALHSQITGAAVVTPPVTPPAAKFNLTRILKQGHKGNDVKRLQQAIGASADGVFGPKTKAAVVAFQKKHKLTADGIVGRNTANKLGWTFQGR